jgi:aspartate 1-decarboxylase
MILNMLKAKIHRATVTHSELNYEGSCAIDGLLLDASGIKEYEQIHIWNVTNGERLWTYAIRAEDDSGIISVNGSAARRAQVGDIIIIAAFAHIENHEADTHKPILCYVDHDNILTAIKNAIPQQRQ